DLYVSQPSGGSSGNNCTAAATPCDTISHALKKVDQTVYACSFAGGGSVNFTGCGSWPVNQAVVMSGTTPGNFQIARPYWVVSSASGTVQLALEPGGAAQPVSGAGGSVSIVADYSHWNLDLMCPGACSSPSNYKGPDTTQIAGSIFGVI